MIYFCYNVFDTEKETNTKHNRWDYICRHWIALFFKFYFHKNHGFTEEDKFWENVIIVEKELNRFDIDDVENFENLPRFVFMEEEYGNLKVVNDNEELTRNINQKKKLDVCTISLLIFTLCQM